MKPILLTLAAALTMLAAPKPTYSNAPMRFEENRGQAASDVAFLARGSGYSLTLGTQGARWTLRDGNSLRMSFRDGTAMSMAGVDRAQGVVNYLTGADARQWKTGVPTYQKVRARSVYPGIDVVYYESEKKLEYDMIVAPGADASRIRLAFDGAVSLGRDGALRIRFGNDEKDEIVQYKPVLYQMTAAGVRQTVAGHYELRNGEVSIAMSAYDHSRELIIDPVLSYASLLGGAGSDAATAVAVDAAGQAVIVGSTSSANFPTSAALQATYAGTQQSNPNRRFGDAFVTKMNALGTDVLFSTYIGGSGDDAAFAVQVDADGNIFVGGITASGNFPTTAEAYRRTYSGQGNNPILTAGDGFVLKLNAAGNALVYSTFLGGSADDVIYGLAIDSTGAAYVCGNTESTNFPLTPGAYQSLIPKTPVVTSWISGDAFIAKLNPAGSALVYSTLLGGRADDMARAIAIDSAGAAYVTGYTISTDFPVTAGALQQTLESADTSRPLGEAFVTKFNPDGKTVAYSTLLGGTQSDTGHSIAVDRTGAAYVAGTTSSGDFPTTQGVLLRFTNGATGQSGDNTRRVFVGADGFVSKINATGTQLVYSTYLGGNGEDAAHAIAVDAAGNAYVAGSTVSAARFPTSADAFQAAFAGGGGPRTALGDAFFVRLSPNGSAADFGTYMGGSDDDTGLGIALDRFGNVYMAGTTASTNFPTTAGAFRRTYASPAAGLPNGDGFVAKITYVTTAPLPNKVVIVSGDKQTGNAGAAAGAPIVVQVQDAAGAGVAGITVTFTGTNATANPTSRVTDTNGRASVNVTLGTTAGPASVTAASSGIGNVRFDFTVNPGGPVAKVTAIVKNGSYTENGAPGVIVSIFGENMAATAVGASAVPFPTTLGGVRVLLNGAPIPLIYVSATQINAQLPYEVAVGDITLTVENGSQTAPGTIKVLAASPGVLYYGTNRAVVVNQNGQVNGPATPAAPGSTVVIYMVGQGRVNPSVVSGAAAPLTQPFSTPALPATLTIGTASVTPAFLGLTPGSVGLLQGNVVVPDLPNGDYAVVLTVGGERSNAPLMAIGR